MVRKSRKLLTFCLVFASLVILVLAANTKCHAWWNGGHGIFTEAAAANLPDDVPAFFRQAGDDLSEMAGEPDNWKHQSAPHLKATEQPEHYLDLEYLEGQPIPKTRAELLKHYFAKGIEPSKAGFLAHAIQEGYERLRIGFVAYRSGPDSKAAQQRVIVYAGWLAHYCQDAAMPLHTTKDYDGKPDAAGELRQKGIHPKIDSYPELQGFTPQVVGKDLKAEPAADVWPLITKAIAASFSHVQKCYELDAAGAFDKDPEKGKEFMLERARAATKLTMDIWYSAWKNSER